MGAIPTKPDPQDNPANREWRRFTRRTRHYWRTGRPQDRAEAQAALRRFAVVFRGLHGDRAVVPFDKETRT